MQSLKQLKKEIKNTNLSYGELSQATGISKAWFSRVMSGELKDPGVSKVEAVLGFFENQKVEE